MAPVISAVAAATPAAGNVPGGDPPPAPRPAAAPAVTPPVALGVHVIICPEQPVLVVEHNGLSIELTINAGVRPLSPSTESKPPACNASLLALPVPYRLLLPS
uniref:Uncharacterized protein n=1 Tax=Oryza brachyantha TaxID=4533 RepID=J3MFD1_ORYBR